MLQLQSTFTLLEQALLQAICEGYPADRTALEAQLSTAAFGRRENTGCGFFTHFTVDRSSSTPLTGERLRNGHPARVDGMTYGLGFILWLEDGYANCLEGYCFGDDSTSGVPLDDLRFEISDKPASC